MKYLVLDSNIVIDYINADETLFSLVSQYVGEVCFVDKMLEEVAELRARSNITELGINLIQAETSEIVEARNLGRKGRLSTYDWLCLIVTRRLKYCCVTNDKGLINQCQAEGIETIRGGRLIVELCRQGGVTKTRAVEIVNEIATLNPHGSNAWLAELVAEIEKL
ncbi:MAG: hypothetical protein IJL92_08880 [Thermoguttaceae bacterium]|nr:hypothetical protein [Thermoguttaceae bacterium]